MERRVFGWTGLSLPVIGEGTWQMERDDRQGCIESLRKGLDAGMTHIDTAELYGRGRVEEMVAEAIAGRRDEVFLASKVLPQNASRRGTLEACERSLKRLKTDRLDLYMLHWPGEHPLEETFAAFFELERAGKIRYFGVSNFDVDEMAQAVAIAGEGRVACNQVLYHLEERSIEAELIPWCEARKIPVVGYSPFGAGRFPAKDKTLNEIAKARGASPYQVALRFLIRSEGVFAIPKSADAAHALDNAKAGDLTLSAEEIAAIDRAFPRKPRRGLPMI
jgi:diketogulonate reductase-like aldo/keto reductase